MYKKQLTVQKILCLAAVIVSALVFVYSLGIMTDLYDSLYDTMRNPNNLLKTDVPGSIVYYNMQEFNRMFLLYSIGLILLAVLLFITNTHKRRKYYIGNFAATAVNAAAGIAVSVWAHIEISAFRNQYLTTVDFAALERRLSRIGTYTDSPFWFDLHWAVFALCLLVSFLLVANAIWKVRLMRDEKSLLQAGKAVS